MRLPSRDAERDRRLLRAAQRGDPRARDGLITSSLPLVRSVANRYRNLGLPLDDLVQEGVIGLLDAVNRFDPATGDDFDRFARFRVRRAIRNALTSQSRLVRLPKHVVERRRVIAHAAGGSARAPAALAAATGLPLKAVTEALAAGVVPVSLDAIATSGADPAAPDPERGAVERETVERLGVALADLPSRKRRIVRRSFGIDAPPQTIAAVAAELGLSRERTRTILRAALDDLRTVLDGSDG